MARLNDYAAPAESVDALKRRFVRQNREIMRVNSMQSMRIRSLESEVSHLLSENVALRGQIITLTQENERLQDGKALQNGVYEIKARLDAKLAELNGLVSDLGSLPRKAGKFAKDKSFDCDRPKTEAPPRLNDPDYIAENEEGKLPAIMEDKYFPRRTLEPKEVHSIVEGDSCVPASPEADLPEARSDTNYDHTEAPENHIEPASPEAFLPPTLETRKKKKRPEAAIPTSDDLESAHITANTEANTASSIKSGSKRKFSLDDDILSDLVPDDDFQFSRLSRSPQKQKDSLQFLQDSPSKTPVASVQKPSSKSSNNVVAKRKVLEPKISNSNLASPKKARATQVDLKPSRKARDENMPSPQKPKDLANTKLKAPPRPRGRPPLATTLQKQKRTTQSNDTDDTPSQPKTTPKDSPMARSRESLSELSEADAGARPSRRRGAVVSYAEPNLRAKMRRPTTEMANAVTNRRSSCFQEGESVDDDEDKEDGDGDGDGATSDDTDPFLAAAPRRRRKVSTSKEDVFSSAAAGTGTGTGAMRTQSRRHSSNPKASDFDDWSQIDSSFEDDASGMGWKLPPAVDAGRRETRVGTRRRSMMV